MARNFRDSMDEYLRYERGDLLRNRYSFVRNLEAGSFGKVTCALDTTTNTKVAIKAMKRTTPGGTFMARHEISIMKRLGYHRSICQLLDVFETRKFIVLVLEYLPGGDMYDAIHNNTSLGMAFQDNPDLFADLCRQLIDVIQFSHSKGVYHRDIKPENLLLAEDGSVKLCDWGLATSAVKCGDFNVGTEKYMAPETLGKHEENDIYDARRADAYSLGITLLYILFGKCPFRRALSSDHNYSKFLASKEYMFDIYPHMSTSGYDAIVDQLLIKRDMDAALDVILREGRNKGFTVDQEYRLEVLSVASQHKKEADAVRDSSLGGEFYMFEEPDVPAREYSDASIKPDSYCTPVDIPSSVVSSSGMAGGSSLFDRVSPSMMESVGSTIPEESYMGKGFRRDIDHCITNFEKRFGS